MRSPIKTVSVIGGGQWGTALSSTIACNLDKITIIAREAEIVESINAHSENTLLFPGIKLASNIR
ncbi:MAG: glycerol-3-phosphate dehydrogenase, partial [Alphaproteobacteria bacterium]